MQIPDWVKWVWRLLIVLAFVCLFYRMHRDEQAFRALNTYIGVFEGPPSTETFLENYGQNAEDLRGVLGELSCKVWMLENHVTQRPTGLCPPDGPPATIPKDPPPYP